jgi:hypothetical protein
MTDNINDLVKSLDETVSQLGLQIVSRDVLMSALVSTETEKFIRRFVEKFVSTDLIRVGGESDGGYLLPKLLDKISHCFSPGVDYTATFEAELSSKYGIKSFLADASVDNVPHQDKNFTFVKMFLGNQTRDEYITLTDWMNSSLDGSEKELLLQMDIEGSEYDVLTLESESTLSKFAVMVIEFHDLQHLFQKHFLQMVSSIFEKIYTSFSICHVHPNNCCGIATYNGIEVPRVTEITFIRNDLLALYKNSHSIKLPHPLDRKNQDANPDLIMPEIWWKRG